MTTIEIKSAIYIDDPYLSSNEFSPAHNLPAGRYTVSRDDRSVWIIAEGREISDAETGYVYGGAVVDTGLLGILPVETVPTWPEVCKADESAQKANADAIEVGGGIIFRVSDGEYRLSSLRDKQTGAVIGAVIE